MSCFCDPKRMNRQRVASLLPGFIFELIYLIFKMLFYIFMQLCDIVPPEYFVFVAPVLVAAYLLDVFQFYQITNIALQLAFADIQGVADFTLHKLVLLGVGFCFDMVL